MGGFQFASKALYYALTYSKAKSAAPMLPASCPVHPVEPVK